MNTKDFRVRPGAKVDLKDVGTGDAGPYKGADDTKAQVDESLARISKLQERLYAEGKRALLLVLQGMDTSGKDGTTKIVMRDVNPQGVEVTSFKAPSKEELSHHFLWRVKQRVPARGMIGVFNRSHYEDILVVRVHNLVPKEIWSTRYEQINDFEKMLCEEYVKIVKVFLHISKDEQKKRLEERLAEKDKLWKFNPADLKEREFWKEYREAYEDALSKCSTAWAPWHIVPADKKWYRNLVVSHLVREALEEIDPEFPKLAFDPKTVKIE